MEENTNKKRKIIGTESLYIIVPLFIIGEYAPKQQPPIICSPNGWFPLYPHAIAISKTDHNIVMRAVVKGKGPEEAWPGTPNISISP